MAPPRGLRTLPRLRAEVPPLNSRALTWTVSAAAGAALVSFAGLIGRGSASPALGWAVALAAAALGRAAASFGGRTDEDGARAWAAAGALAALAAPALLRVLGLSLPDPALLNEPLGGASAAVFVLGQAGLLAALAAGAWSRAARGTGAPGAAAALAGAAAAALGVRAAEPALLLAAAALAVLLAAVLLEKPWARRASAPLRARAFAAAAAAGLGLASLSPHLLAAVWMARLHSVYPGGGYLALDDDGTRLWGAYRFSSGAAVMLRDGVPQTSDPATTRLAALILLGQSDGEKRLLLSRPPEALIALTAQTDGAYVTIEDGSAAEAAALDALGGGREWRKQLAAPEKPAAPNAALLFLPTPEGSVRARLAGRRALKTVQARLADGAIAGVLFPPDADPRDVDAAAADAAAVFGGARVADLPKGVLVLASEAEITTDPERLSEHLKAYSSAPDPELSALLTQGARWRPVPSAK